MTFLAKTSITAIAAILLVCPACGPPAVDSVEWTPEAKLLAARETFNGTVRSHPCKSSACTVARAGEEGSGPLLSPCQRRSARLTTFSVAAATYH